MPTSDSNVVVNVSTRFTGAHLHYPSDPAGTLIVLKYGGADGRSQDFVPSKTRVVLQGRPYPVMDVGTAQEEDLKMSSLLGYEDEQYREKLDAMEDMVRSNEVLMYRDGRRRGIYGSMDSLTLTDTDLATVIDFSFTRLDYTEEVV